MKFHAEIKKPIIALAVTALIAVMAFFCVRFFINGNEYVPPFPSTSRSQLEAVSANKKGKSEDTGKIDESSSEIKSKEAVESKADSSEKTDSKDVVNSSSTVSDSSQNSSHDSSQDSKSSDEITFSHTDQSHSQADSKSEISSEKSTDKLSDSISASENNVTHRYFSTSIKNGETVSESTYDFSIKQLDKSLTLTDTRVYVNDIEVTQFKGSILLSEDNYGNNVIRILCVYKDKDSRIFRGEKSYLVIYKSDTVREDFGIVTDLGDKTVSSESFDFTAYLSGGKSDAKLTVAVNGKIVRPNGNMYSCVLREGKNSVRLRGKSGTDTAEKLVTITYLSAQNSAKLPKISSVNVSDNMTVKNTSFTLHVFATDYFGKALSADKISVYVNGILYRYISKDSGVNYCIKLSEGSNKLLIRLSDGNSNSCDYEYKIICKKSTDNAGIADISLDAKTLGIDTLCNGKFTIKSGETAADTIKRFLLENGFTPVFSNDNSDGQYLSRIKKVGAFSAAHVNEKLGEILSKNSIRQNGKSSADSLGELDFTSASGWIFTVNGKQVSYGMSQVAINDGDKVRLTFTLALGRDIKGAENPYEQTW